MFIIIFLDTLVVSFIELKRFVGQRAILYQSLKLDWALTNYVVALKKVPIVALKIKFVVLPWPFNSEDQSILKIRFSILVPVMSICLLHILWSVEKPSEINIAGSFNVHYFNIFSIKYANSNFKFFIWLLCDIVNFRLWLHINWINFNPALDDTLADCARLMINLSVLYRFILKWLPFLTKVSIL